VQFLYTGSQDLQRSRLWLPRLVFRDIPLGPVGGDRRTRPSVRFRWDVARSTDVVGGTGEDNLTFPFGEVDAGVRACCDNDNGER